MYSRNELLVTGLFVLSLIIAAGGATLLALGFLTAPFFVPLAVSLALAIVIAALAVSVSAVSGRDGGSADYRRKVVCGCGSTYLRPSIVSALVALVVALVFSGASGVSLIVAAVLFGLTVLFLLFALFLLAAFILCVLDSVCHYCHCNDDNCQ
ncbi:MAG: hypothetical protein ABF904_00310 [Ethanoligenens sp.]